MLAKYKLISSIVINIQNLKCNEGSYGNSKKMEMLLDERK